MKAKTYPTALVAQIANDIAAVPAQKPEYIEHSAALSELARPIRTMFFKKNYNIKQIVDFLREKGIRTSQKEVKDLVKKLTPTSRKNSIDV